MGWKPLSETKWCTRWHPFTLFAFPHICCTHSLNLSIFPNFHHGGLTCPPCHSETWINIKIFQTFNRYNLNRAQSSSTLNHLCKYTMCSLNYNFVQKCPTCNQQISYNAIIIKQYKYGALHKRMIWHFWQYWYLVLIFYLAILII